MRLTRCDERPRLTYLLILVMLAILALCATRAHAQAAYNKDVQTAKITTSAKTATFLNGIGSLNETLEFIVSGSPTTLSVATQGCMRAGTCDALDTYTGTGNANRKLTGLYDYYTVTPTWTGGATPTVQINYLSSAASSPGALNMDPCANQGTIKLSAPIAAAATAKLVSAGSGGQQIFVCQYSFTGAGTTPTFQLSYGTGVTCGTNAQTLTGALAPSTGQFVIAGFGGTLATVPAGNDFCIVLAGVGANAQGSVTYVSQ